MGGYKFLKPSSPDIIVRDPISKTRLPVEGAMKPWIGREGNYWRRRAKNGSVVVSNKKPESKPKIDKKIEFKKDKREEIK